MWNLSEELVLIDLGNDFYLLKLKNDEIYIKVLRGGPWLANILSPIGDGNLNFVHLLLFALRR